MSPPPETRDTRTPDFLVFSDDWGEHPSSCQHIFRHIAQDHRVLWVNTIGMRNPTFTLADARKIMLKASKMLSFRRKRGRQPGPPGHLVVCQPLMLPFGRLRLVRAFNAWSVTRRVRSALRSMRAQEPVVVATVPNASEYVQLLSDRRVIYYCVDDFTLWPGIDSQLVDDMERRLVAQAAEIIAVSDTLRKKFSASGKATHVLTHGVDLERFSNLPGAEHPVLRNIPRPRAGFFGLIDGRLDRDLVRDLAGKMPEISFVFAGPVDASAGELPKASNLYFPGPIPYAQLPAFVTGITVLILPYRTGGLSQALSPLKLREYLATKRPIVSAPVAAADDWKGSVSVAQSPAEWRIALCAALRADPRERASAVSNRLAAESWAGKSQNFLGICVGHAGTQGDELEPTIASAAATVIDR